MFEIKTVPRCPKTILQCYQADEDLGVEFTGKFEVKAKEKSFSTYIIIEAILVQGHLKRVKILTSHLIVHSSMTNFLTSLSISTLRLRK